MARIDIEKLLNEAGGFTKYKCKKCGVSFREPSSLAWDATSILGHVEKNGNVVVDETDSGGEEQVIVCNECGTPTDF